MENRNTVTSCRLSQNGRSSSTPNVLPPEHKACPTHHTSSRLGTVIPNRIFVGGIDHKITESDLRYVFSQHGVVKEVKIVMDRSGIPKGFGFVTFENQDDALKILHDTNGIYLKNKTLSIGQAVRKQHTSGQTKSLPVAIPDSATPAPMACGTLYLTTSTGNPYTYHNGVAYFQCLNMNPPAHHWPPAPPVMLPQSQSVYQQPAYHPYQCVPNQYPWNVAQLPVPSRPVVYSQQSEYLYPPTDGGSVSPLLPFMENPPPEFLEPMVQQVCPLYPQRTEGMSPFVLPRDPGKNQMSPQSGFHLKPK